MFAGSTVGTVSEIFGTPMANRLDLFWAPNMGGLDLGFYLSYANAAEDNSSPGDSGDFDATEFNIGAGANLMNGTLEVAANVGIGSGEITDPAPGAETSLGPADTETDVMTISLLVRHHGSALGGDLISTLHYDRVDTETTPAGAPSVDSTTDAVTLNSTLNSRPNEDTLFCGWNWHRVQFHIERA